MFVTTRQMCSADIPSVAAIHEECFIRQKNSLLWIEATLNSYPKTISYIAEKSSNPVAYILWTQKSGFRENAVVELEQMGVLSTHRNQGIAKKLITESLAMLKQELQSNGSTLKHLLVQTASGNHASKIYESTLGVELEHTLSGLFSRDEIMLVARNLT